MLVLYWDVGQRSGGWSEIRRLVIYQEFGQDQEDDLRSGGLSEIMWIVGYQDVSQRSGGWSEISRMVRD